MYKPFVISFVLPAALAVAFSVALPVSAKLPPISDDARQKAAESAARSAWNDKIAAYKLCLSMERTAEHYRRSVKLGGKEPPAPGDTPPCSDPGPFSPITPVAQKPLEAAGAHSPPGTANGPPSTNATAAEIQGKK